MTKRLTDAEIIGIADQTRTAGLSEYILPISFARAIESAVLERSKQAEPVIAYIVEGFEGNTVIAKHLSFEPQQAKDTASVFSQHYPTVSTRALYAAPQPAQVNQQLLEALKLAVKQNEHDMLMTGDELRKCSAAIAAAQEVKK